MTGPTAPGVGLLLVGPDQHGVVQFGRRLAHALPDLPVVSTRTWRGDPAVLEPLRDCRLVHVQVTDRLFGARCEDAADAVTGLARTLGAQGAGMSVTLHDLPAGDDALDRRRSAAYRRIGVVSRGVVLSSHHEENLFSRIGSTASVAVVPLPVDPPSDPTPHPRAARDAAVLGFLYPGKGHDEVLRALPPGLSLTAIGRAADGHEDLVAGLRGLARAVGREVTVTGFVHDSALGPLLRAAGVPVAPHRTVSASGSIGTWLGAGRRPLVPDIDYTREFAHRWPGALWIYEDLGDALAEAVAEPARTWLGSTPVGPGTTEVAAAYARTLASWT